jgi:hypothetical protein
MQQRGVNTSSAFAICTSSLQRAGKLPRGKSKKEADVEFSEWAKKVSLPKAFLKPLMKVWDHFAAGDVNLLKTLRKIVVLDEDQSDHKDAAKRERDLATKRRVLGQARLHSKTIALNPKALKRLGDHPVWHGAVAIHEAQHATYGFGEHEATHAEQRWLGKLFAEYSLDFNKPAMTLAIRAAAVAQAQREKDVHHAHRVKDFHFLNSVGFTARAARKIVSLGRAMDKYRRERSAVGAAKDFYEMLPWHEEAIEKTVNAELQEAWGDLVEKTFMPVAHGVERLSTNGSDRYMTESALKGRSGGRNPYMGQPAGMTQTDETIDAAQSEPAQPRWCGNSPYDDRHDYMITADTPTPWTTVTGMMERYVNRSVRRRVGKELRGPLGVVPALRRAGWDVNNLPPEWKVRRAESLKECVAAVETQGLFDDQGDVTDAHLLCLLHAWTPVPHLIFDDDSIDVVLT